MKMNKLLFVPFLVGAFALTSCGESQHYSVTLVSEGEHGTWKGNDYAQVGADYKATFTPEAGYVLDEAAITVKINNVRTVGCYTFDDNLLVISKDYVVGNIEVIARPNLVQYSASVNVSNVTADYEEPQYHKQFDVTFTTGKYRIPDQLDVYVGTNPLKEGEGYEYNKEEKTLSVFAQYVEDDITVRGEGVKLTTITFNGNGGYWDTETSKTILVDANSKFGDIKSKVDTPKIKDNSKTFEYWTYNSVKVDDEYIVKDNDQFDAFYVTSKFRINITDGSSYFPSDYIKETVEFGEKVDRILKIEEKDWPNFQMPLDSDVSITCKQQPIGTYTRSEDKHSATISIPAGKIVDDVEIRMQTPRLATVVFSTGDGYWDAEKSKKDDTSVSLVTNKTYTVLEAWRFAQEQLEVTNDPVANDNSKVFVGWKREDGTTVTANSEVRSSMTLIAQYAGRTFENDTWENVVLAANSGLDFVLSTYKELKGDPNNLLAAKRNVVVGDPTNGYVQEQVRVIGVAQDKIANGGKKNADGDEMAALTFEFCDTFAVSNFGNDNVYVESNVRKLLNGTLIHSIPTFNTLTDITTVRKVEKQTWSSLTDSIETTDDEYFLLSANEMSLTSEDMPQKANVDIEGAVYQLYANKTAEFRKKGTTSFADNSNYWLRSPNHSDSVLGNLNVYAINENGVVTSPGVDETLGIAPAFAIGLAEHTHHKGTISTTNCVCTSHSDGFVISDNEKGFVSDITFKANEGYLFDSAKDVAVNVAPKNEGEQATITKCSVSDDHKTLTCTLTYNELAANPDTCTITLSASPSQQGYAGTFVLTHCTSDSGVTGFPVYKGKGGKIENVQFTSREGYIFSGKIDKDIVITKKAGECTITAHEYSADRTYLKISLTYNDAAAVGDINIAVNADIVGYRGYILTNNCQILDGEPSIFAIERGKEADVACTTIVQATENHYFNKINPEVSLSYECSAAGGEVTFSKFAVSDDGTQLTFTIGYNEAASYGSISISVSSVSPNEFSMSGSNCYVNYQPTNTKIIPGSPFECTGSAEVKQNYLFDEPLESNFKFTTLGEIEIIIDENKSTREYIYFTIKCDGVATSSNISIAVVAYIA